MNYLFCYVKNIYYSRSHDSRTVACDHHDPSEIVSSVLKHHEIKPSIKQI